MLPTSRHHILLLVGRVCVFVKYFGGRNTLGPAYEFGYNEHSAITNSFLCIRLIDSNVKKFGYNKHPLRNNSFFSICLFVISGPQCNLRIATSLYVKTK